MVIRSNVLGVVLVLGISGSTSCTVPRDSAGDVPRATDPATLAGEPLVPLADVDPRLHFDVRYATPRNFTGQVLYGSDVLLLRAPVAERLKRVHDRLLAKGVSLLVWDAYRPVSVQERMWALVPDERYVADPAKGSKHNRGAAVDVTLCDRSGNPLEMPTDHDDFSEKAHRDHAGGSKAARANCAMLEAAMVAEGFIGLPTEWWHFDDPDWEHYPIVGARVTALPR